MKSTAEKIAVMQAYENGERIVMNEGERSEVTFDKLGASHSPIWDWYRNDYKVARPSRDEIDWSAVSPRFNYLVRDPDGMAYLMTELPHYATSFGPVPYGQSRLLMNPTGWSASTPENQRIANAGDFASYKPGDLEWYRSLVKRPEA